MGFFGGEYAKAHNKGCFVPCPLPAEGSLGAATCAEQMARHPGLLSNQGLHSQLFENKQFSYLMHFHTVKLVSGCWGWMAQWEEQPGWGHCRWGWRRWRWGEVLRVPIRAEGRGKWTFHECGVWGDCTSVCPQECHCAHTKAWCTVICGKWSDRSEVSSGDVSVSAISL